MRTTRRNRFTTAAIAALFALPALLVGATAAASSDVSSDGDARKVFELIEMSAEVVAVDLEKYQVTLRGPFGGLQTIQVDRSRKRLNEVSPGDRVKIDHYMSVATDIREPTPEELKVPFRMIEASAEAMPGTPPGVGSVQMFRVVVTIEAIDRAASRVTVRGPQGVTRRLRAADPTRLEKINVGDTVVVTFTEAVAISVEKI